MTQDTVGFHELYQRYARDVYRFAYWLTGDAAEAKDITSETFVRVWTATAEPRLESVKAYLFAIARNLHLQGRRRANRRAALDETIRDPNPSPHQKAEVQSELETTLKALQTLSEIDRTVLIMRAEDEMSYEEIARVTGLSVSAVKVKVFRARARIYSLVRGESI